jgi:hypothetical protein
MPKRQTTTGGTKNKGKSKTRSKTESKSKTIVSKDIESNRKKQGQEQADIMHSRQDKGKRNKTGSIRDDRGIENTTR